LPPVTVYNAKIPICEKDMPLSMFDEETERLVAEVLSDAIEEYKKNKDSNVGLAGILHLLKPTINDFHSEGLKISHQCRLIEQKIGAPVSYKAYYKWVTRHLGKQKEWMSRGDEKKLT
jgi:hypothetical protein